MILFPASLYHGERLSQCSDAARLHFPMIAGLVNGFGRFQLNVPKILDEAYATFRKKPTKEQIASWLREYRDNHLLYVYQSGSEIWGQLCGIPENALPRYRTAADKRTPAPDQKSLDAFNAEYCEKKRQRHEACSDFIDLSEHFGNLPKVSEDSEIFSLVVGEDEDVGVGEDVGERQKQILVFPVAPESELPAVTRDEPPAEAPEADTARAVVRHVFEHYVTTVGLTSAYELTDERMTYGLRVLAKLTKRFKGDAAKAEAAMGAAVDGLAATDWNMGRNPKTNGKRYVKWESHVFDNLEERWEAAGWAA